MMQQQASESLSPTNVVEQEVGRNQGQVIGQMHGSQAFSVQEVREGGIFVAGNVTFQSSRLDRSQPTPYLSKRELPSLLPYLPNRSDQEFDLGQAFQKCLSQASPHPLVCIIHGDEFQSHDKFLERLQKLSIPRLLGFDPSQTQIKEYPLDWPAGLKNLNDLSARLCKNLADSVLGRSFSSLDNINKALCKYPDPVIVHTHLLTEDWQEGNEVLKKLLEFWQDWPDLLPGQQLIICLFIKYQMKQQRSSEGFLLTWLLGYLKGLVRKWQYRRINTTIHKQIEELKADNCQQFDRLSVIVLPQLSGISRTHVENWARSEETKQFVGEAMIGRLIDAIGEMFDSWEEKTSSNIIPMDDLADNLINLLKSLVMVGGSVE
jgi:hypothetical protein